MHITHTSIKKMQSESQDIKKQVIVVFFKNNQSRDKDSTHNYQAGLKIYCLTERYTKISQAIIRKYRLISPFD